MQKHGMLLLGLAEAVGWPRGSTRCRGGCSPILGRAGEIPRRRLREPQLSEGMRSGAAIENAAAEIRAVGYSLSEMLPASGSPCRAPGADHDELQGRGSAG